MRGLFHQPRPRHFSHRFLYIDERKEQLRLLRETQQSGDREREEKTSDRKERLHALFAESARRRKAKRHSTTTAAWLWGALAATAAAIILLLLGAWW